MSEPCESIGSDEPGGSFGTGGSGESGDSIGSDGPGSPDGSGEPFLWAVSHRSELA